MSRIYNFTVIIFLLCFVFTPGIAQTAGDYQTAQPGNWSTTSTWQRWSGSAWLAAPHYPDTADGAINILAGHTVHVDIDVSVDSVVVDGTLIIDAAKTLEVDSTSSTAADIHGVVAGSGGTISVDGTYKHNRLRGSIPTATWNAGSTCLVSDVADETPGNANQSFCNFTWDCPGQSDNLNLAWLNNTIGGDIRVIATGSSSLYQLRMTASGTSTTPGANTITILGNIFVDSSLAFFTSTGSSGSDTIVVILNGDITSKGTFDLARGSGAQCNWYVKGNINVLGGAFSTNSQIGISGERADTLFIAGTTRQTFVNAIGSLSNVRMVVQNGATLDLDTSRIGGGDTQTFALDSGATLITARADGLGGNLNNGGGISLSTAANYEYDGTVLQVADTTMPAAVNNLTINNPTGVALMQSTTVSGTLNLAAGVLDTCIYHTVVDVPPANITGPGSIACYVVGVETISYGLGAPREFQLYSNYPNPFNPATMIQFTVPKDGHAVLKVFNILGQEVATLFDGQARAGQYITAMFNASSLASGVYMAHLEYGGRSLTRRMVLAK